MTVKRNLRRALRRLLCSRTGTAEIIGSVMFLLIMMFFFTNVFLWHDRATREMDGVLSEKMNSLVSIQVVSMDVTIKSAVLNVTNNGGVDIVLSRLWIITPIEHNYTDLENGQEIWVAAGATEKLYLNEPDPPEHPAFSVEGHTIYYDFPPAPYYTFKILTARGNTAACRFP
jgi:hypothetical protein